MSVGHGLVALDEKCETTKGKIKTQCRRIQLLNLALMAQPPVLSPGSLQPFPLNELLCCDSLRHNDRDTTQGQRYQKALIY